jgi:hypothetical protein
MIGVGGATVGAFAYKYGKAGKKMGEKLRFTSKSNNKMDNKTNDKHSQTNSENFNQHHDNTPFDELSNYTKKWQEII